jgi:hypothetical protein
MAARCDPVQAATQTLPAVRRVMEEEGEKTQDWQEFLYQPFSVH